MEGGKAGFRGPDQNYRITTISLSIVLQPNYFDFSLLTFIYRFCTCLDFNSPTPARIRFQLLVRSRFLYPNNPPSIYSFTGPAFFFFHQFASSLYTASLLWTSAFVLLHCALYCFQLQDTICSNAATIP